MISGTGSKAVLSWRLNAREAALLTGGATGKNSLYYHEKWGSLICIHTIATELDLSEEYEKSFEMCGDCDICVKTCPAGAIYEKGGISRSKCIRQHINGIMPAEMREYVYQLFGCELCQICCPKNNIKDIEPKSFDIGEILKGGHINELISCAGKNTARKNRVISQAILYAGAKKYTEFSELVQNYIDSETAPVREHARWAIKRFKGER